MSVDLAWISAGGMLIDGTGDIAFTASPWQCLKDMVDTRLKAAFNGWKLYSIGADLEACIGKTVSAELQATIERQVQSVLTLDFLPAGTFQVKTIAAGKSIQVFVFVQKSLLTSITVNL